MLWEVEIWPKELDPEAARIRQDFSLLTHRDAPPDLIGLAVRGFLLEGRLGSEQVRQLLHELLLDPLTEEARFQELGTQAAIENPGTSLKPIATVILKPGVMDPVAQSVHETARSLGIPVESVRTLRRYYAVKPPDHGTREILFNKVLANDAIEQIVEGPLRLDHLAVGTAYDFHLVRVALRELDDAALLDLSRSGHLSLNLGEMKAIQDHFRGLGRDPTDVELETLAQTWSEHCSHKTLKGQIDYVAADGKTRRYANLLKETIFGATQEIRRRLGDRDWCVSVFEDNAGVIRFHENYHVCFKVETHNHPSAIEPYGGANTGLGGVIRDPLGTGLGAKPVCNTDVFCFAPPDTPPENMPPGVLHPRKVMQGVVAGVRDYGNRMGIPTVNGAVCFDDRYVGNPLVFCGTVGLIPVDRAHKEARPGDLVVTVGGRTGRDGIHGATFSSIELTSESESVSGGAVQIGNPITEKKLLDVILQARDQGLYNAITDCGAGGFSSAVGEMAEKLGAIVHLERAPLKYEGLSYTEIWISEAQERMILAVPPQKWPDLEALCRSEDVEATVMGTFENTGRLRLFFQGNLVADLDMHFLHHGRPPLVRQAQATCTSTEVREATTSAPSLNLNDVLLRILSSYNVCSKEWIVRQYDHEVQGGTVIKPLVGIEDDGPGDAAVITPILGSWQGLAIGCGINPHYGDRDPYAMAAAAIDEAVRNVVAVGADPNHIALLDNFCWGNTDRPEVLGSLVEAAQACSDVALAFSMPFISGKDSLNNEFRADDRSITIPPTLLISALGRVPDVRRCVTMDLKEVSQALYLIGTTRDEMGGSHFNLVTRRTGGEVPRVDTILAPKVFQKLHQAIVAGIVRSCHDLSEGGLAAAVAEMAFAGGIGADITAAASDECALSDETLLFSESTSRFVVEVPPAKQKAFEEIMGQAVPCRLIGHTVKEKRLRIAGKNGEWIIWLDLKQLKEAWQKPLRWTVPEAESIKSR
jgi:phosphoribosylformylglycinamidine synthase subunit PurSL